MMQGKGGGKRRRVGQADSQLESPKIRSKNKDRRGNTLTEKKKKRLFLWEKPPCRKAKSYDFRDTNPSASEKGDSTKRL